MKLTEREWRRMCKCGHQAKLHNLGDGGCYECNCNKFETTLNHRIEKGENK